MAKLKFNLTNPKLGESEKIVLWDFQIENHINAVEHSIKLLKQNSPDSTSQLIAGFFERDLNRFKQTVQSRKEGALS